MSYILLASIAGNFAKRVATKINDSNHPPSATFITSAANPYTRKVWMEKDIESFEKQSIKITRVDFATLSETKCHTIIQNTTTLIVGGGNTVYLLEIFQQKNLLRKIATRVENGMYYIGSSAGAVIASSNVKLEKPFDDRKDSTKLPSYDGLGISTVFILPHWGNKDFKKDYLSMLNLAYNQDIPLLTLTDTQALEITNKNSRIIFATNV